MNKKQNIWKWVEGPVDRLSEHIELYYADINSEESGRLIALLGPPKDYTFSVTWIAKNTNPDEVPMIEATRRELDFYLLEVGGPDPWAYACYHCTTTANFYSNVHWVYVPGEKPKDQKHGLHRHKKR